MWAIKSFFRPFDDIRDLIFLCDCNVSPSPPAPLLLPSSSSSPHPQDITCCKCLLPPPELLLSPAVCDPLRSLLRPWLRRQRSRQAISSSTKTSLLPIGFTPSSAPPRGLSPLQAASSFSLGHHLTLRPSIPRGLLSQRVRHQRQSLVTSFQLPPWGAQACFPAVRAGTIILPRVCSAPATTGHSKVGSGRGYDNRGCVKPSNQEYQPDPASSLNFRLKVGGGEGG